MQHKTEDLPLVFLSYIIISPVLISIILNLLFKIFPEISNNTIIMVILAISLLFSIFIKNIAKEVMLIMLNIIKTLLKFILCSFWSAIVVIIFIIIIFEILYIQLGSIILTNDILEYLLDAKILYKYKDISIYPLWDVSKTNGLYFPSTHPPGFPLLVAWSYFPTGPYSTICFRLMTFWYTILWIGLMGAIANKILNNSGLIAISLLLGMPFVCDRIVKLEADIVRLATFQAVIVIGCYLIKFKNQHWYHFLVFGLCSGFTIIIHSISLLILPILGGSLVVTNLKNSKFILKLVFISLPICIFFGGYQYIWNIIHINTPINDYVPIWELDILKWDLDFSLIRNLNNFVNRIINGPLDIISNHKLWGISGIISLIGFLLAIAYHNNDKISINFILMTVFYFIILLIAVIFNIQLFIRNPRYIMAIIDLLIPISAVGLVNFNQKKLRKFFNKKLYSLSKLIKYLFILYLICIIMLIGFIGKIFLSKPIILVTKGDKELIQTFNDTRSSIIRTLNGLDNKNIVILSGMHSLISFYTDFINISDNDPRCESLYQSETIEEFIYELNKLKVTHIIKEYWNFPFHYRTPFLDVITTPDKAKLIHGAQGNYIFEITNNTLLNKPILSKTIKSIPIRHINDRLLFDFVNLILDNKLTKLNLTNTISNKFEYYYFITDKSISFVPKNAREIIVKSDINGLGTLYLMVDEMTKKQRNIYYINLGSFNNENRESMARFLVKDDLISLKIAFVIRNNLYYDFNINNIKIDFYTK
jgi:hypothetical protein